MKKQHLLTAVALLIAAAVQAAAQAPPPLAEVARREEARRKSLGKTSKVYTNDDLRPDISSTPPPPVSTNATPAGPTSQVPSLNLPGGKAEPVPEEKDQAYWKGRIGAARAALDRSKIFADALQSRINALSTDFVNRDDPAQRSQIELERQRAMAELDRVKKDIGDQTKAIADIEEEARRAGVPPGWLR
jgi:hypothetical protein